MEFTIEKGPLDFGIGQCDRTSVVDLDTDETLQEKQISVNTLKTLITDTYTEQIKQREWAAFLQNAE